MKLEKRLIHLIEEQLAGLSREQQMDAYRAIAAFCTGQIEKKIDESLQRLAEERREHGFATTGVSQR